MINDPSRPYALAPLVLRLALAGILLYHGGWKIVGDRNEAGAAWATTLRLQQEKPPKDVLARLDHMADRAKEDKDDKKAKEIDQVKDHLTRDYAGAANPLPATLGYPAVQVAVAWGEVVGGLALLAGILTRLAALGILVIQVGAIWTVTWAKGFSFADGGGYEFNLALLAMCIALAILGGGALSVDHLLRRRKRQAAHPAPVAV
jgi:uncharacterized membrane protein YphA (DoxX/SURF4 family)